jgi:pimeloyl-ACP methyl ester carboxylesterase
MYSVANDGARSRILAIVLALIGPAAFSSIAARRIQAIAPPQGSFLDTDGARLHFVDQGIGPPLVLIHGLGGQIGNFTYALADGLNKEFRIVAFDRPGSGYSTSVASVQPGIADQAAMFAKAIGRLKLGRRVIVGHSFGVVIALMLALDHPHCVSALALIAPVRHPVGRGRMLAVFAPEAPPPDFALRGGGVLALRPSNIEATSAELTAGLALRHDFDSVTPRYASLDIPVGILFGRGDHVLNWRTQGLSMKEKRCSLDLELVDGGHILPGRSLTPAPHSPAGSQSVPRRGATSNEARRLLRTFQSAIRPKIRSAAFSPIMVDGASVLPLIRIGMIEASATRKPWTPRTRRVGSTTERSSLPIRHVPTGW